MITVESEEGRIQLWGTLLLRIWEDAEIDDIRELCLELEARF